MAKVLVKLDINCSDEFDCEGFFIVDTASEKEMRSNWEGFISENPGRELYFGSNEYVIADEIDLDYDIKFTIISDVDADVIRRTIGSSYGTYPRSLEDILINKVYD